MNKNTKFVFIVITVVIISICVCFYYYSQNQDGDVDNYIDEQINMEIEPITLADLKIDKTNYPRVDSSTSAHPLQTLIACRVLDMDCDWTSYLFDETKRIVFKKDGNFMYNELSDKIAISGTHGAYVNLIENKADLILVARTPSPDELDLARKKNIELDIRPVAIDAFVFIVNKENNVKDLSVKEVQDIYTGKITNWKEVGGIDKEINAYQRNRNSGSQELMNKLVMKDLKMIDAPELILMGMMGPINAVSWDKEGLGYSVYFYEKFMAPNESLKLVSVNGVIPNFDTLKSENYSLTAEVYVVTKKNIDKESETYKLRSWVLSEEGQEVVKESGYVPIRD